MAGVVNDLEQFDNADSNDEYIPCESTGYEYSDAMPIVDTSRRPCGRRGSLPGANLAASLPIVNDVNEK